MAARIRRTTANQKERDILRAAALMRRLYDFVMDEEDNPKKRMTPGQVQAAQIALKKLVPDLASIEQMIHDERDAMTEEQIIANMKLLLEQSPDTAQVLRELLNPKKEPPTSSVIYC